MKVQFDGLELQVQPTEDSKHWYMTVEEVAQGYGVDRTTVMFHLKKHANELREGTEKGVSNLHTHGGIQQKTILYREGVIKLGFFIRSSRAKIFRQFATNLVIDYMDKASVSMPQIFERFKQMDARFDHVEDICRGLRDDVDELQMALGSIIHEDYHSTIRSKLKEVRQHLNLDGRTVAGMIRKELGVSNFRLPSIAKQIINCCNRLMGKGISLVETKGEV